MKSIPTWSPEEDTTLRRIYPSQGAAAASKALGRSLKSIKSRAERLGLRRDRPSTIEAIKARCTVNPVTHCWEWRGATTHGQPRVWAFDASAGEKRSITGACAVWQIAFGRKPRPGEIVYRACGCILCLNPAHLRAGPKSAMGENIRLSGRWAGLPCSPARLRALDLARKARGTTPTDRNIVIAIRQAPSTVTTTALALQHGISVQTASRIRTGRSHRHLLLAA